MAKKCVYCRLEIQDKRALDVCNKCVWGERMFNAILQGMNNADKKGDLGMEHEIPQEKI